MNDIFISFDEVRSRLQHILQNSPPNLGEDGLIFLVRDLFGKLRVVAPEKFKENLDVNGELLEFAKRLNKELGAHSYHPDEAIIFIDTDNLEASRNIVRMKKYNTNIFLDDRLISGKGWWTINESRESSSAKRITMYSIKGGVGRSTTTAVLAWYLANRGEQVLVVDLDLESPGLSSMMLEQDRQPKFGVTDWFVEELVDQGNSVVKEILATPAWTLDLEGDVRVAPAHGVDAGEYLAKLGRVYMDTEKYPWTARLNRLLFQLENQFKATVTLIESRNGLHDIAAATVTDIDADVMLFAADGESTWTDYGILFSHWNDLGLASTIRERIYLVSALTPEPGREAYLHNFRTRSWDLFREHLYDELGSSTTGQEDFSFDMNEEDAPHNPIEINWTLGLFAGTSLRRMDPSNIESAYGRFLNPFVQRFFSNYDT